VRRSFAHRRELILHLSARELKSSHRRTALGWSWPLFVQLAQLAALTFLFTRVVRLDIPNYPAFVFTGLVFWNFFSSGVTSASTSITDHVSLVLEPRMPTAVLPMIALAVAGFDLVIATGVLVLLLTLQIGWSLTALWVLVLLPLQLLLMIGLALLVSAAHVRVRDIRPLVGVVMLLGFYMTPIFYSLDVVPERFENFITLNPMAVIIDGYHGALIDGEAPDLLRLTIVLLVGLVALVAGVLTFRRLQGTFADEL
jgi:lipopolysaccharide transport system permease protein